jgi:hypothetical protein
MIVLPFDLPLVIKRIVLGWFNGAWRIESL